VCCEEVAGTLLLLWQILNENGALLRRLEDLVRRTHQHQPLALLQAELPQVRIVLQQPAREVIELALEHQHRLVGVDLHRRKHLLLPFHAHRRHRGVRPVWGESRESLVSSRVGSVPKAGRRGAQVQDCIQQNNELRAMLNQLRLEQSSMIAATDVESSGVVEAHTEGGGPGSWMAERTKLKIELAKALARSEELSAHLAQQSADLNRAVQADVNC
jgi:hypothetical protein